MGAVRRGQRRPLLALEIVVDYEFVVALGQDQVDAGPIEVRVEQQMRIGHHKGARGWLGMQRIGLYMVGLYMAVCAVSGPGVDAANVVQLNTTMKAVNIYVILLPAISPGLAGRNCL